MNNYDLIKFFFSQENEKMINEKILDDVDYIVPKDRILEYINKVIDIPYADFITYLKDSPSNHQIDSSHITQCSSFTACESYLCKALIEENNLGFDCAEIGILLSEFISSNKSCALRKYGENQIKTASQLGLVFEYYNHWYLSCLGYVYLDLNQERRTSLLARTLLRDPLYAQIVKDITQRDIHLKSYMGFLSISTINRRIPSVWKLLSICLSECDKYHILYNNTLDVEGTCKSVDIDDRDSLLRIGLRDEEQKDKKKEKSEILRVTFPDGKVIQHKKVVDTFIEVIESNFPDLIHELNIVHAGVNLVTKERSQQYASAQREIADGWLVFTNINTRRKREDLIKISNELELDLKVDIVSIATGEIINLEDEPSTSTRQKIKVTFPDGRTIQPNKVLEVLVEVVKYAGPERVRDLGIIVCADNLVLKNPKPRYEKPCKPVGNGWLVNTCSDTPTKYEQIKQISDELGLNLQVEIISSESKPSSYVNNNINSNSCIISDCPSHYAVRDTNSMLTVDDIVQWTENLRTFKYNGIGSPHKPVYILSIIKLITEGHIVDGKIYLNNLLIDTFRNMWNIVVPRPNSFTMDICNPYIHMASEPFYKLKMKRNDISYLEVKKSIGAIQESCEYAEIDSRFVEIIRNPKNATIINEHICDYYKLSSII